MTDEMDTMGEDYFGDGDLAAPEVLPEGKRYIGIISGVDTSLAAPGNFRKLNKALKDGRTEVPQITVNVRALRFASGDEFPEEANYLSQGKLDFWVSKQDKIGRNSLANLVRNVTAMADEEVKVTPIRELATKLDKAYVTFEVKHRAGQKEGQKFQDFVKVKAATSDEVALVM